MRREAQYEQIDPGDLQLPCRRILRRVVLRIATEDINYLEPNARQHGTMFENVDGKQFVDVSNEMGRDFLQMGFRRGSAFVDLNNDGAMDLVLTSLRETPRIPIGGRYRVAVPMRIRPAA